MGIVTDEAYVVVLNIYISSTFDLRVVENLKDLYKSFFFSKLDILTVTNLFKK